MEAIFRMLEWIISIVEKDVPLIVVYSILISILDYYASVLKIPQWITQEIDWHECLYYGKVMTTITQLIGRSTMFTPMGT